MCRQNDRYSCYGSLLEVRDFPVHDFAVVKRKIIESVFFEETIHLFSYARLILWPWTGKFILILKTLLLRAVKFDGPYRNILSISPRGDVRKMAESESVCLLFVGDINYRVYVGN